MGSQMSFARKIGLKSLILDKNAQNWPNLGSLGPHKSKTAYGMTKIFFCNTPHIRPINPNNGFYGQKPL